MIKGWEGVTEPGSSATEGFMSVDRRAGESLSLPCGNP